MDVAESGVDASASSPPPPPSLDPLWREEVRESAKEAFDSDGLRPTPRELTPTTFSSPKVPPPPDIAAAKLWRTKPEEDVANEDGRSSGDSGSGVYLWENEEKEGEET